MSFSHPNDCMDDIALPMKWCFARFFSISIYDVNEIGIPCIFRRINGNNRKMKGIIRLINGDEILTIDINCRNDEEWLNSRITSQSM